MHKRSQSLKDRVFSLEGYNRGNNWILIIKEKLKSLGGIDLLSAYSDATFDFLLLDTIVSTAFCALFSSRQAKITWHPISVSAKTVSSPILLLLLLFWD